MQGTLMRLLYRTRCQRAEPVWHSGSLQAHGRYELLGLGEDVSHAVFHFSGNEMESVKIAAWTQLDVIVEIENDALLVLARNQADAMRNRINGRRGFVASLEMTTSRAVP
jgi:hypothetical protein